ncbi:MAG: hypothetical protein HYX59_07605 [Elusimicrobia bacterium]|nr:hypothetical protein [Elusimicrobiota bacterium]
MTGTAGLRRTIEIFAAVLMLLLLVSALARKPAAPSDLAATAAAAIDNPVVLNIRTLVYHCPACDLVRNCGTDCVTVDVAEARRRGAKPCVTCGGICLARR